MKICEWENVCCPFCSSNNVEDKGTCYFSFNAVLKEMKRSFKPIHKVFCLNCLGAFYIRCED